MSTSNLPFASRSEVLGEAKLASSMIDRIIHWTDVIALKGRRYRIEHTATESNISVAAAAEADSKPELAHPSAGQSAHISTEPDTWYTGRPRSR